MKWFIVVCRQIRPFFLHLWLKENTWSRTCRLRCSTVCICWHQLSKHFWFDDPVPSRDLDGTLRISSFCCCSRCHACFREEQEDENAVGMKSIDSFMVRPKKARANLFAKRGLELVDTFSWYMDQGGRARCPLPAPPPSFACISLSNWKWPSLLRAYLSRCLLSFVGITMDERRTPNRPERRQIIAMALYLHV